MKKLVFALLVVLVPVFLSGYAPPKEFTGVIVYNISYDSENMDPQMASYLPKTMKMTVKAPMSRMEMSMGMGSNITIFDSETREGVSLVDMMGMKIAVKTTAEDMEKEIQEAGDIEVEKFDETKEILGYTCKKAVVKVKGSGDLTVYYTDEIDTGIDNSSNVIFRDIEGMMLEFEMDQDGLKMHFVAVNIDKKKVSDDLFQIPEGFEEMTKEEMESRFGM
jgi:hypothetical protein